jgi:hypothetical protein
MKILRYIKRLGIALFSILLIDGCFYRDPGVNVGNGYWIASASSSIPCSLFYKHSDDDRTYSDYHASPKRDILVNHEPQTSPYSLLNLSEPYDSMTFETKEEWLDAIQKYNAVPDEAYLELEGVTSFAADESHIIGEYQKGYYVVNVSKNTLETFDSLDAWQKAVSVRTTLTSDKLQSPHGLFVQEREGVMLVFYAFIALVAIVPRPGEFSKIGTKDNNPRLRTSRSG